MSVKELQTELVVLGSGPGGYAAAFRAADLGVKDVIVVERDKFGGVCLNVGCIPSKALLHIAKVKEEAESLSAHGVTFDKPSIDIDKIRAWKDSVVTKLTGGLGMLAKQRKVQVVEGVGTFTSPNTLEVKNKSGEVTKITFKNAIIAAGSRPVELSFMPKDERIMDSTGALQLADVKGDMLIVGGGIIGLEMATVYHALGSSISVVEFMDQLIPGADRDLIAPYQKKLKSRYKEIMLKTKVTHVDAKKDGLYVTFEGAEAQAKPVRYDRILCAVGRRPNGDQIGADAAGVTVNERGFITVDSQMRTNVSHIFAIGDIVGNPMLAHKATHEGHVAAEVVAGLKHSFNARCIPSVAYTDPEIAWVGLTEQEATAKGIKVGKGAFPWAASGRALSMGLREGLTKVLVDEATHRIIGAGVIGQNAGELIAEIALAIEMGCDISDVALTVHPHPTLSETLGFAAEVFEGTITDLYLPKK